CSIRGARDEGASLDWRAWGASPRSSPTSSLKGSPMKQTSDGANVRLPPPLIYVVGLALGLAAGRVFHLPNLGLTSGMRDLIGGLLCVAGCATSFAGAGLFLCRRTAILP